MKISIQKNINGYPYKWIQPLKENLSSLATDESLFSMEKKSQHYFENIYVSEAILELYEINELVSQLKINWTKNKPDQCSGFAAGYAL